MAGLSCRSGRQIRLLLVVLVAITGFIALRTLNVTRKQNLPVFCGPEILGMYEDNTTMFQSIVASFHEGQDHRVAIGVSITSAGLNDETIENYEDKFLFFTTLAPSFCKTASKGYNYTFYLAYDETDAFYSNKDTRMTFGKSTRDFMSRNCESAGLSVELRFVECAHTGRPAWAQNDAMMASYLDGNEYFYRINDDSLLESKGWTEAFIAALQANSPPNVGVVGPNHTGGNLEILTHVFVHRTHFEIFGFYYPRLFMDWWADSWITKVYRPNHSSKIENIHLRHTKALGRRYRLNTYLRGIKLDHQVNLYRQTLNRYLDYRNTPSPLADAMGKRLIVMCLYGNDPRFTMGAVRNAQLSPVVFPGWKLRIYLPATDDETMFNHLVSQNIVETLAGLGAQLVHVKTNRGPLSLKLWRYLVADEMDVDYVLVRNADERLSDRDSAAVAAWVDGGAALHCFRDDPIQAPAAFIDGHCDVNTRGLRKLLPSTVRELLTHHQQIAFAHTSTITSSRIMHADLWCVLANHTLFHDSVNCGNRHNCVSVSPANSHSVGQKFDQFQDPINNHTIRKYPSYLLLLVQMVLSYLITCGVATSHTIYT